MTTSKIGSALMARMKKVGDAVAKWFARADTGHLRPPATAGQGEYPSNPGKPPSGGFARPAANTMVIRDTFSMPRSDYKLIESLRSLAARQGYIHTKSEVIRAALRLLSRQPPAGLISELGEVERVRPGRKVM